MLYRNIGTTDIKVSEIGFGCWTMGGPNWSPVNGQAIGWAEVNEDEVVAGIKAGLDAGVNHWDNADNYGNGKAERLLAKCLEKLGVNRKTQIIASKVGHSKGTALHGYEPHHIRNQCEQSLRNLGTDYLDIYYFHHGTFIGPGYDGAPRDYLHEAAAVMQTLVKEGKVRAVGQSGYSDDDFERAVPIVKPDVLQTKANLRFDDFIRAGSRCQALLNRYKCTFVAFGPLDQGILLDKFDPKNPPQFSEGDYRTSRKDFNVRTLESVRENLAKVRAHFASAAAPGSPDDMAFLSSIASRWVLSHANVCSTIPGFRNARQALCNVKAGTDAPMSQPDAQWLRELFDK